MKKQFVQSITSNAKYLNDEDFLKPVKTKGKKRKKKKKTSHKTFQKQEPSTSEHDSQHIIRLLESHGYKIQSNKKQEETPAWAKLARASSLPNKRFY